MFQPVSSFYRDIKCKQKFGFEEKKSLATSPVWLLFVSGKEEV